MQNLEALPTVEIEAKLLARRPTIQFDPADGAAHLRNRELDDDAIRATTIYLKPRKLFDIFWGDYNIKEPGECTLRIGRRTKQKKVNKHLYHELEHRAEHHKGNIREKLQIAKAWHAYGLVTLGMEAINITAGVIGAKDLYLASLGQEALWGMLTFGSIGFLYASKEERRARRASREYTKPLIRFTEKPHKR